MNRVAYSIARRDDGRWAVAVHGTTLTFDTRERAIEGVTLAARTDELCGKQTVITVQEEDGSVRRFVPS